MGWRCSFLQEIGEVPAAESVVDATPVEALLAEFRVWLFGERGLSSTTVCCYGKQVLHLTSRR